MYDYNNGRFLSIDPFIQSPSSTQSMNPYTYIFNNPLSGIDPTGYTAQQEPKAAATAVLQKPRKQGFTLKSGLIFTGAHISTGDNIPEKNGNDSTGVDGPETKSSPNKNISDFGSPMDSLAVSRAELTRMRKVQQKQMRACKAIKVRECSGGITPKQIDEHRGNPSGTDPITNPDTVNPNFEDKVVISDSKIEITVNYSSKGDAKSNKRAIINLRKENKAASVILKFDKVDDPSDANLIIHSATFAEIYEMCLISSCEAAYGFGGKRLKDGQTIVINSGNSDDLSDIVAHEFGHRLGLEHRKDGGIMDYKESKREGAGEEVKESDAERIRRLYEKSDDEN